ncbi:hypothetical protein V2H45_00800 [Tumidithrix elongata RA019]|uniref:Uncharacterized protein n=1 Tax=Tumidithrix elongata BACA0141 TaxID=2716417 RepID=A0AAW9PSH2_9CYAN|nr:hypothetical protein [Tumidithrix elongata RA019]
MITNLINSAAASITERPIQSPIESPSIWHDSLQRPNAKKNYRQNNIHVISASTIPEVDYKNTNVDTPTTYIENTEVALNLRDRFLTDFPELNLAAVRLQKLEKKIDSKTLHTTFGLLSKLFNLSKKNNLWWSLPLINVDPDSKVILEWWHGEKKLDFDISGSNIEYIKVWGADIDREMEDGFTTMNENILSSLWMWIAN